VFKMIINDGGGGTTGSTGGTQAQKQAMANYFGVGKRATWPGKATPKPAVRAPAKRVNTPARSGAIARRVSAPRQQYSGNGRTTAVSKPAVTKPAAVAAPAPRPPAPPAPPSIEQFLRGDTAYMGQEAGLKAGMDQYNTDYNQRQAQYGTEYGMNKDNLAKALTEANTGMTDDYASRGMLNSGTYGTAYADQQTEYNGRQTALDNARNQWLAEQLSGQTAATSESALSGQKARQDAINRRAAQYAV